MRLLVAGLTEFAQLRGFGRNLRKSMNQLFECTQFNLRSPELILDTLDLDFIIGDRAQKELTRLFR